MRFVFFALTFFLSRGGLFLFLYWILDHSDFSENSLIGHWSYMWLLTSMRHSFRCLIVLLNIYESLFNNVSKLYWSHWRSYHELNWSYDTFRVSLCPPFYPLISRRCVWCCWWTLRDTFSWTLWVVDDDASKPFEIPFHKPFEYLIILTFRGTLA
jgi:hypothetical protein